jgi:demethylmenaquinone methyltransferase/2-methoxy-6-polyprenyl-1,4-benzoquinol methylase
MSTPHTEGPEPAKIRAMFGDIAHSYDKANSWLSAGIHNLWRQQLVRWSDVRPGDSVLDCATGTGDLAIEFRKITGDQGTVVGSDFTPEMLAFAPQKASMFQGKGIRFEVADMMALPYANQTFQIASVSFGIRNVADPKKALQELARVVKPGGRVMILEFGQPKPGLFRHFYEFYSRHVLPVVGGWLSGSQEAYRYLEASSAKFPCGEAFLEIARGTDKFSNLEFRSLNFGLVYAYKLTAK